MIPNIPLSWLRRSWWQLGALGFAFFCFLALIHQAPAAAPPAAPAPELGVNANLHGKRPFLADSLWNQDVSKLPVDPKSQAIIARIGADKPLHPDFGTGTIGIPYVVVAGN